MDYSIDLCQRPGLIDMAITEQVVDITKELTGEWFTPDVPDSVRMDLKFQDVVCLEIGGKVVAFIMFTSCDGAINLTLVGARLNARGKGYGSRLMEYLIKHVRHLGFNRMEVLTIPPKQMPRYEATVCFYQKHGFVIDREITDLWESSPALKLVKSLTPQQTMEIGGS